jgi:hypothetical protein
MVNISSPRSDMEDLAIPQPARQGMTCLPGSPWENGVVLRGHRQARRQRAGLILVGPSSLSRRWAIAGQIAQHHLTGFNLHDGIALM